MNTAIILNYLSALSANNSREWYHANKEDYKKANAEFEKLLQELMLEIGTFDSSILQHNPKDLTFKIVPRIILHSAPILPQKASCRFRPGIIL